MATKRKAAKSKPAGKRTLSPRSAAQRALSIATNPRNTVKQRSAAAMASVAAFSSEKNFLALLAVLVNAAEPIQVRLAALQSLQAASFAGRAFEACRGDYVIAIRKIAEDRDPELRQRALGILSRMKDGFAQKKLLEGLRNPAAALVPPEKALQLLSYDVHADAYEAARAIVRKPPNETARREALRLLAADPGSAPLFEKLMRDKKELREIRQISASALYTLKPDRMQKSAREILLDKSDYDDIKATSLTALAQLGDGEALAKDKTLLKSVDRFGAGKTQAKYKQTARRFLSKFGG